MQGRTIVITGATSGLGRAVAEALAARGDRLLLLGRDPARLADTLETLKAETGNGALRGFLADLSLRADVARVADEISAESGSIALLLNNAGAVNGLARRETSEGLEHTFALNHLAYFQLTLRLLDALAPGTDGVPPRIVNVASNAWRSAGGPFDFDDPQAQRGYRPDRQYGRSKLANILFTQELARRVRGRGIETLAWSPKKLTATRFAYGAHRLAPWFMKLTHPFAARTSDAARPLIRLCEPDCPTPFDGRFVWGEEVDDVTAASDEDARRLWELSAELAGVK